MTNEEVNWNEVWTTEETEDTNMVLKDLPMGGSANVHFESVRGPNNMIVATVKSEELEGNTLWLKGKFGPQNGLLSLIKAADGGENIEGNTFNIEKIESDKSPVGYAFKWSTV